MRSSNDKQASYRQRKKWFSAVSLIVMAVVLVLLTIFFTKVLSPYLSSAESLRAFLDSYGWKGRFILLGLQCLQVVIALIPGEVIELGAGYAYGAIEGTLLCMAGVALSSSVIFLLVKKIGMPMVELFISREKIHQFKFLNDKSKVKRLIFLLFLIPGTPKDALTYFVGLTDLKLSTFLGISMIARIPSILSSTICGQLLGDRDFVTAGIVYAITGAISIAGYLLYSFIMKKRQTTAKYAKKDRP